MSVTINVRYLYLTKSSEELKKMSRQIAGKKLDVTLNESSGEFKREMVTLADELEKAGKAFAEIANQTAIALEEAKKQFEAADDKAVGLYGR